MTHFSYLLDDAIVTKKEHRNAYPEWSPIRSVILRVINKIGRPWSGSPIRKLRVLLQTELDDTTSCYQLIKTITEFGKETRHRIYFFYKKRKKPSVYSAKCETITRAHDAICPLTQAWRVTVLLHCPITSMTRRLSYWCSNRARDNQSRSKNLL